MVSTGPRRKTFSFGGCEFGKVSPPLPSLSDQTAILNVTLSFEDSLKLSLAIDECIRKLNSYNRSTAEGRRSALNIAIHLSKGRITVNEGSLERPQHSLQLLPRVLLQQLMANRPDLPKPRLGVALMARPFGPSLKVEPNKPIEARILFAVEENGQHREELRKCIKQYARVEPASKFGISGDIDVIGMDEIRRIVRQKKMYLYSAGRTWMTDGPITPAKLSALLETEPRGKWPPIVSNVRVHEKPRPLIDEE